jgi:glucose-1-phosphate thymidylyltransferase
LPVAGAPMIEWVLGKLAAIPEISRVLVVTNAKFAATFEAWAAGYRPKRPHWEVTVLNDGSTTNENRLGAIGDMHFTLERSPVAGDLIVVAGDNLFSQALGEFGCFCLARQEPVLAVYDVGSLEEVKKYNSIEVDPTGRITHFEEKAPHPTSTLTGIALYYYPHLVLPLIREYIAQGNNPDQPGRLVQWMFRQRPFYTWRVPGTWYDIGSRETFEEANRVFATIPLEG